MEAEGAEADNRALTRKAQYDVHALADAKQRSLSLVLSTADEGCRGVHAVVIGTESRHDGAGPCAVLHLVVRVVCDRIAFAPPLVIEVQIGKKCQCASSAHWTTRRRTSACRLFHLLGLSKVLRYSLRVEHA